MLINKRGITRVMFCYQTGGPITGGGGVDGGTYKWHCNVSYHGLRASRVLVHW